MRIAIVNNTTHNIHHIYEDETLRYDMFCCMLGDSNYFTHVKINDDVPEVPIECLVCINTENGYIIKADPDACTILEQTQMDSAWKVLRSERNLLLRDSDWVFMPDVNLPEFKKQEWKEYRQALRDLPSVTNDPRKMEWPVKPY